MYDAFDNYLARETWHRREALDDQAFYPCLANVVKNEAFDPEKMGEYFGQKKNVSPGANPELYQAIQSRVQDAHAVRDFLRITGG